MTVSYPDDTSFIADDDQYIHVNASPGSGSIIYQARGVQERNPTHLLGQTSPTSTHESPISRVNTEDAAADLLALRYRPSQQKMTHPSHIAQVLDLSPLNANIPQDTNELPFLEQGIFDYQQDGIFWPGSAYQEFHSTLRDHLIYTARSNAPTRRGTPEAPQLDLNFNEGHVLKRGVDGNKTDSDPESDRPSRASEITPQREYVLWKTWIDEVAPWVRH